MSWLPNSSLIILLCFQNVFIVSEWVQTVAASVTWPPTSTWWDLPAPSPYHHKTLSGTNFCLIHFLFPLTGKWMSSCNFLGSCYSLVLILLTLFYCFFLLLLLSSSLSSGFLFLLIKKSNAKKIRFLFPWV